MNTAKSRLPALLKKHEASILPAWLAEQEKVISRQGVLKEGELRTQMSQFLQMLQETAQQGDLSDLSGREWDGIKDFLGNISSSRGLQGFSPSETATFVFSLKRPVFEKMCAELGDNAKAFAEEFSAVTELFDKLGLFTMESYQKTREEMILRQQQELLELSTPVVKLWDGILALPMIGTLDSERTQVVMETLLQKIVDTGSDVAIIDITGVPTVDTLVAQHLLKTVTAARLMGADCIISGIRPQIAQTIVHLGVELGDVTTKANISDAFALALKRRNLVVCKARTVVAAQA